MEEQTEKTDLWILGDGRREKVRCMERATWKFTIPYVKKIVNGTLLCDSGKADGLCDRLKGGIGGR